MNLYPKFLADGRGDCAVDPYPDHWTEEGMHKINQVHRAHAIAVCQGCPFRDPCLEWAMKTEVEGVYGGTTTNFRKDLRAYRRHMAAAR